MTLVCRVQLLTISNIYMFVCIYICKYRCTQIAVCRRLHTYTPVVQLYSQAETLPTFKPRCYIPSYRSHSFMRLTLAQSD